MTCRKTNLYEEIFTYIRDECFAHPTVFMSDYEEAMRKAARATWAGIQTPGCAFHYCQAIRKAYMMKVLKKPKKNTRRSRVHANIRRMTMNLQYLPAAEMINGAIGILNYQIMTGVRRAFRNFNKYLTNHWIGTVKPENFSMYRRLHRTNNISESFNARLNKSVFRRPNIYSFLDGIKKMTVAANQRDPEKYENNSKLTPNLNLAWDALDNGRITGEDFVQLNLYDPFMVV